MDTEPTFTYWERITRCWEARLDEDGNVVKVDPENPETTDIHENGVYDPPAEGLADYWEVTN